MATCKDDCHYFVLATQASIRHNMYNCLVTSLGSLLALERYLGLLQTPGWNPMNREKIHKIMENAAKAKKKSAIDLRIINDTLKEGCPNCKLRQNDAQQNQLPIIPEELIENIENLQVDFDLQSPSPKPNLL